MVGDFKNKKNRGIIPRTLNYLYEQIDKILKEEGSKKTESKFTISLSFIQLYLESIQDLIDPGQKEIKIKEDIENGIYLEGVQFVKCDSPEQCEELFHLGERNRTTESTRMNAHSSRSHAILIVKIERSLKVATKTKVKNIKQESDRIITSSKLYLVDLAGSERVKKTGATDMRLEEAKKINLSLLALGNVISALSESKTKHISYRDSKLTRLLQDSIGGNSKTSLIVTVSPSTYNTEETISSLLFASRAMKVQNKPIVNKTVDYQALCIKLQEDLDKLNDDYGKLKIEYEKAVTELESIKKGAKYLEIRKSINSPDGEGIVQTSESSNTSANASKSNSNVSNEKINKTNEDIKKLKLDFKKKMKKLEEFYENLIKTKTEEFENILKKVDSITYEKENQIDQLNSQVSELNKTIKSQKTDIEDLTKEKDDLQKSVIDLSTQLQEQKELISQDKTEKEYKALIEQLNETITMLENKLTKLEDSSTIDYDSKEKLSNNLNAKIEEFQNEINNLNQKLNDYKIKKNQNEIKLKLSKEEALKSKSVKEKLKKEIIEGQKENFKLIMEEESTNKRINIIEKEIECAKNLNDNLDTLINEYMQQNKSQLILDLVNKEIDNKIKEAKIENYENAFNSIKQQEFETKFQLFKGEGDLNSIINKVLFLNNNYQNNINNIYKLDDMNKELNQVMAEPDSWEKLSKMRDNIQILLEETQRINKLVKKEMHKDFSSVSLDDNIPFEKCPNSLDKLFKNVFDNFNTLINSYNTMNSNVCLLLLFLDTSFNGKKQIISCFSNLIQEKISDASIKDDLNNQIITLNECGANTIQYYNKLEQLIKDLFGKPIKGTEDMSKTNKTSNNKKQEETINLSNEEALTLTEAVEGQNKTISDFKTKITELKKGVNGLNEFLKSNEKSGKIDVKKISKIFSGYNEQINTINAKLDEVENSDNTKTTELLDKLKKMLGIMKDKDLNPRFLIGQFFTNVSNFSFDLYSYGLKETEPIK